jgi:excisionase family DNA binding protein
MTMEVSRMPPRRLKPPEDWFTLQDLAERFPPHEDTWRRIITRGELRAYRFGGLVYVARADLESYLARIRFEPEAEYGVEHVDPDAAA